MRKLTHTNEIESFRDVLPRQHSNMLEYLLESFDIALNTLQEIYCFKKDTGQLVAVMDGNYCINQDLLQKYSGKSTFESFTIEH